MMISFHVPFFTVCPHPILYQWFPLLLCRQTFLIRATSVPASIERISIMTRLIVVSTFVSSANALDLVTILMIALNALAFSIEGSSILHQGLCYDWFLIHVISFLLFFLFLLIRIHARYAWTIVSLPHVKHMLVHRPFLCAQTIPN